MRIGIDVSWAQGASSGTASYVAGLVEALVRVDADRANEYVLFTRDAGRARALPHVDAPNVYRLSVDAPLTNVRQQMALPLAIRRQRLDLYHSPAFFLPALLPLVWRGPVVLGVFDVNYLKLRENWKPGRRVMYLSLALQVPMAVRQATRLITLSEASAHDIGRHLHVPRSRISIIPAAPREFFRLPSEPGLLKEMRARYGSFFLSVGVLAPQKNLERVLRAFARIDDVSTRLVYAGRSAGGYVDEVLRPLARQLGVEGRVEFATSTDDDTLRALYHAAVALVYPSLGEGFGLPIVEAMVCGCPVVTSDMSSMPEVAGDAALLVDPRDVDAIAGAMERLALDEDVRRELIARGHARAARFTWDEAARQTLHCYNEAARAHHVAS